MDGVDQPPPDRPDVSDLLTAWPLTAGTEVRDALLAAYGDPSRGYHDTLHLGEVLARIAELAENGTPFDRVPVTLAGWFHDSIYDGERDAEERSAAWAEDALADIAEPSVVAEAARLVRLTETHRPDEGDDNGCALSDADLAILAAPPERYAAYVVDVRREYSHLTDDVFEAGRADVLRDLLAKPRLFHTAYALKHWEDAARTNMEAELAGLPAEVDAAER
jgi:predicted metal-dependent HD superfamily phosphohydrolase